MDILEIQICVSQSYVQTCSKNILSLSYKVTYTAFAYSRFHYLFFTYMDNFKCEYVADIFVLHIYNVMYVNIHAF